MTSPTPYVRSFTYVMSLACSAEELVAVLRVALVYRQPVATAKRSDTLGLALADGMEMVFVASMSAIIACTAVASVVQVACADGHDSISTAIPVKRVRRKSWVKNRPQPASAAAAKCNASVVLKAYCLSLRQSFRLVHSTTPRRRRQRPHALPVVAHDVHRGAD